MLTPDNGRRIFYSDLSEFYNIALLIAVSFQEKNYTYWFTCRFQARLDYIK